MDIGAVAVQDSRAKSRFWNPKSQEDVEAGIANHAYDDYLYTIVRSIGVPSNDQEDVVLHAQLNGYKGFVTYDKTRPFMPWLGKIARNLSTDYRRKNRVVPTSLESFIEDGGVLQAEPEADHFCDTYTYRQILEAGIKRLSPEYREIVELHCEDVSNADVATRLGITTINVKNRFFRAKLQLAEDLVDFFLKEKGNVLEPAKALQECVRYYGRQLNDADINVCIRRALERRMKKQQR